MDLDIDEQRVTLKAVYYGPALSGKTTSILRLHDRLPQDRRGDLITLDTYQDSTLFFDLLPFYIEAPSGLGIKIKVCTVPGQVRYDATRKAVLSRADGIIFVADSQVTEQRNNAEGLRNLEENCQALGMDLAKMPLIIQFNKRDLSDIVSEEQVTERWGSTGVPIRFSSALHGINVVAVFLELMEMMYDNCDTKIKLHEKHGLSKEDFIGKLGIKND